LLSPEQRRHAAIKLADFVIKKTNVEETQYIDELLADKTISDPEKKRLLNALAEKTDIHYFELEIAGDPECITYFLRAKAISAMEYALSADDFETFAHCVSEALAALVPDVLEFDKAFRDSVPVGLDRLGDVAVQLGLSETNPLTPEAPATQRHNEGG